MKVKQSAEARMVKCGEERLGSRWVGGATVGREVSLTLKRENLCSVISQCPPPGRLVVSQQVGGPDLQREPWGWGG